MSESDFIADRVRGVPATASSHFDSAPVQIETWDDLVNVGKQKKYAKYVQNADYRMQNFMIIFIHQS